MPQSTPNRSVRRTPWRRDERGAAMIEVAMTLPILFLLVFAIMEFSYAATQNAEIRHVAEEGARAAAVSGAVHAAICDNLVVVDGASYTIGAGGGLPDGEAMRTLVVTAGYTSLTGLIPGWTLSAEHAIYIETAGGAIPAGGVC